MVMVVVLRLFLRFLDGEAQGVYVLAITCVAILALFVLRWR